MPHILMCPPDHFGIEYEINPWMNRSRQSDQTLARQQWEALRQTLEEAGAEVALLDPARALSDLVFTGNAARGYRRPSVVARGRQPERQGHEPHGKACRAAHGFEIRRPPEGAFFEGAGDALFCGDTL